MAGAAGNGNFGSDCQPCFFDGRFRWIDLEGSRSRCVRERNKANIHHCLERANAKDCRSTCSGYGTCYVWVHHAKCVTQSVGVRIYIGVSQGASFGAAVSIIYLGAGTQVNTGSGSVASLTITNPAMVTFCAFLGGVATTAVILALSRLRGVTPSVMVLAGVAISSMFSGGTTLVQYFADDVMVATVVHWTFGNLGRAGWGEITLIAELSLVAFLFFYYHRWSYNAMESGTHTAKSLGVPVDFLIPTSMVICALISSVSVAFVGCINFIGLIASHIMRRFVGNDFRFLIPCTALCGAVLMLASDIACRMLVPPVVLPIGALTSFLGAPLFLWLIMRRGSVK